MHSRPAGVVAKHLGYWRRGATDQGALDQPLAMPTAKRAMNAEPSSALPHSSYYLLITVLTVR